MDDKLDKTQINMQTSLQLGKLKSTSLFYCPLLITNNFKANGSPQLPEYTIQAKGKSLFSSCLLSCHKSSQGKLLIAV